MDTPAARGHRHAVRRHPERASYDRSALYAVLDGAFMAHVAFAIDGQPFVIPMLHARDGDRVLLHGSVSGRLLQTLAGGAPCSLAVTLLDALVLARSQFSHSVNYRSAVVFGRAHEIVDLDEKARCLYRFTDAVLAGRAADSRAADASELAATKVLAVTIEDASVKQRSGGPKDHPHDMLLPVWAGVVPLRMTHGPPEVDPAGVRVPLPAYLRGA